MDEKLKAPDGVGWTMVCPKCLHDEFYQEAPLFIPLKTKYYEAFERGEKDTEYRPRNDRWNATTCRIGRPVVLARGYGKTHRLYGEIVGFSYDTVPSKLPGWTACYGNQAGDACCIKIKLINND